MTTRLYAPIPLAIALLLAAGCSRSEPSWSAHASSYLQNGGFGVVVHVRDEARALAGVRVKGPGMSEYGGEFRYDPAGGEWVGSVALGATHPPPPLSYEVELSDGAKTRYATAVVTCFIDNVPTILAPSAGALVTSPVTFAWAAMPDAGVRYVMGVAEAHTVEGQTSITLPLSAGTYDWWLEAERVEQNERLCWSRAVQGPFTVAPCGSATSHEQRPVAGLDAVETPPSSPAQVTLAANPALVDGNVASSAGVDLGYALTVGGDTRPRHVGVELADNVTSVDELHVWVDRPLPPDVSASYAWRAYRSDDDVVWTEIALDGPVRFGTDASRFEIPIARTEARFLAAVASPLAAGITSDPALASVMVTEVQVFRVEALACVTGSTATLE